MDIDKTVGDSGGSGGAVAGTLSSSRSIKMRPLAIIGISDHHTRVVTGGSALPKTAPVVGLLFGYYSNENSGGGSGRDVSIVDAEEMEYPKNGGNEDPSHRAAILKKIELHQKVFPQHRVVGWYRVQKHDENSMNVDVMPSEEDLVMNQTEMTRYCSGSHGSENATISDDDVEAPLFVLMNASKTVEESSGDKKPSSTSNNASEEMEVDEELPLAVYETLSTAESSAVFVNADFELDTPEPERIAVEKVFKTQPSKSAMASVAKDSADASTAAADKEKEEEATTATAGGGDDSRKTGKKSKKDDDKQEKKPSKPPFTRGSTELDSTEDSLQSSIRAMNIRMNVLLEFLQKVKAGEIAPDDTLLRSVDGLVRQLPLVLAALEEGQAVSTGRKPLRELEHEHSNTMLLTYLAAVAKTAKSVHVYSEKFNSVAGSSNGGNIGRRGGPPMMY